MYNGLKYFLTFAAGAAVGTAVAYKLLEKKFAQIAREEIDDVIAWYEGKAVKAAEPEEDTTEEDRVDAKNIIESEGYISDNTKKEGDSETMSDIKPYVISPEEFGEMDDYEKVSLRYTADEVLVDEMGEVFEDIDETVGPDFHKHFGEYEADSVFIRNDELETDYEILLDSSDYLNQADDE